MICLADWRIRASLLTCFIVAPFLKFIAENEYGFLHAEVAAGAVLLLIPCLLLGWLARGKAFYVVAGFCIVMAGTYPLVHLVKPLFRMRLWEGAALLTLGSAALMKVMRERFFPVIAVFAWSGVLAATGLHAHVNLRGALGLDGNRSGNVLWLLLDEEMGPGGFPARPECDAAREKLSQTLLKYNFTLFPNAYSNYAGTIDSVPSILNGRLLQSAGELIVQTGEGNLRQYQIRANSTFEGFAAQGYHVIGYQHSSMRMCDPSFASAECREYAEGLPRLHDVGTWLDRFQWLVGNYQASDPWMVKARGFFPFHLRMRITGPLGLADLWPDRLAREILKEKRRTFFFVHLMTPHSPYLYRPDGSIRHMKEWIEDRADERVIGSEYDHRYGRYCEQVQFVAGQLDSFLRTLKWSGDLESMTVVIHGDHGSRIRRLLRPAPGNASSEDVDAEEIDFVDPPPTRDLLDRFSTLLAVKRAGAKAAAVDQEKHSVLTLLSRVLYHREPRDGAQASDRVYLFDSQKRYRPIDILKYWR